MRKEYDEAHSVSSRAPVWGASAEEAFGAPVIAVSSRAPVWGASYSPLF